MYSKIFCILLLFASITTVCAGDVVFYAYEHDGSGGKTKEYIQGYTDAIEHHRSEEYFFATLLGGIMTHPAASCTIMILVVTFKSWPRPYYSYSNKELHDNPEYIKGYQITARRRNFRAVLIGTIAAGLVKSLLSTSFGT